MKIEFINSCILSLMDTATKLSMRTNIDTLNEYELRDILKHINISFVAIGINRAQSTLLCELSDSYIQQSQRYVDMSTMSIYIPKHSPNVLHTKFKKICETAWQLYNDMTELNEDSTSKRKTASDFKYGISYEDARYILPLATTTNVTVTMSGDKLIDLYTLMINHIGLFNDMMDIFTIHIPIDIHDKLLSIANNIEYKDDHVSLMHKIHIDALTYESDVLHIDSDGLCNVSIATLTSQQADSPTDVFDEWRNKYSIGEMHKKSVDMVERVVGYGHNAILEHHRSTFAMMCSLSAYHQLIRHRLQKISRVSLNTLCNPDTFYIYYPDSIMKSPFADRYLDLMTSYKHFLDKYYKSLSPDHLMMVLPNALMIRFIVSSNARNDNWIFRERLCLTAQHEIRTLFKRKFDQLYAMYPELYQYGIPPCITHNKCKEGGMTCGRTEEMRAIFKLPKKIN